MINQILSVLKISALALVLSIGLSYAFAAWAPPTELPPNGNVDAPINVGTDPQTKAGDICTEAGGGVCLSTVGGGGSSLPSGVAGQTLRNVGGTNWATSSLIFNNGTNVGIGTASPNTLLTVGTGTNTYPTTPAGSTAVTLNGPSLLRMVMNDGTGNFQEYLNSYYDSASATHKYQQSSPANRFVTSGGTYGFYVAPTGTAGNNISWITALGIDNSGNVGIGTTAPTAKLDVAGNIRQTVTHGNNMGLVLPAANNGGGTGQVGLYSWISEPAATWTGGGISRNMINSSGSFPRVNTGLSGQMMHFTEGGNIEFTTETTGGYRTTPLAMTNAGNVGIGTTAPAYKLDVSGSSRVTGGMSAGSVSAGTFYDSTIGAYTTEVPVAAVDTSGNWPWTRVVSSACNTCGTTRSGGLYLSATLPVLGIRISGPTGSTCVANISGFFHGGVASNRSRFTDLDIDYMWSAHSYGYGSLGDSTFIFDRVLSGRDLGSQDELYPGVLKTAYNKAAGLTHIRPGQWLSYSQWSYGTQYNTCYIDVLYGNYR